MRDPFFTQRERFFEKENVLWENILCERERGIREREKTFYERFFRSEKTFYARV